VRILAVILLAGIFCLVGGVTYLVVFLMATRR